MNPNSQRQVVICSYRPKAGKQAELLKVLEDHVPSLRMLGFASGYPRTLLFAEDQTVLEIFEWESAQASKSAHDHPEVRKIWGEIEKLADIVPLTALGETQKPFATFKQAENMRQHRVIHFEIEADDPAKVRKFYEQVFGWEFNQFGQNEYWLADTGREPCPGIDGAVMKRKQPEGGVTNTILVESVDEYVKKVEQAGGKICVPKMSIPGVGLIAYGMDPEQNVFGMIQPDMSAK